MWWGETGKGCGGVNYQGVLGVMSERTGGGSARVTVCNKVEWKNVESKRHSKRKQTVENDAGGKLAELGLD